MPPKSRSNHCDWKQGIDAVDHSRNWKVPLFVSYNRNDVKTALTSVSDNDQRSADAQQSACRSRGSRGGRNFRLGQFLRQLQCQWKVKGGDHRAHDKCPAHAEVSCNKKTCVDNQNDARYRQGTPCTYQSGAAGYPSRQDSFWQNQKPKGKGRHCRPYNYHHIILYFLLHKENPSCVLFL